MIDIARPLNICRASAGTGKTYTLAAYYIGLLLSGEDYRSILAITFTNKATAEMGERILGYLHDISEGKAQAFLGYARTFMYAQADAPEELLYARAHECFRQMLLDYDNVKIQTIDAFLQTLLNGLTGVLQMSMGLQTELDIDHVIAQAVDQLLTTDLSEQDKVLLEDYMQVRLENASNWDIRQSLRDLAKSLYNEAAQQLDADGKILFDAAVIGRRREALEAAWANNADLQALRDVLQQCDPEKYGRNDLAAYNRLLRSVEAPDKISAADRFRGVKEKSKFPELLEATEIARRLRTVYNTQQAFLRSSRAMQLMASLQTLIQRNLAESNTALLAQTATILSNALKTGDADFILEKAGIRYKHLLIDEFQDTSRLQWSVINQLVRDLLAGEGHTLLVVGDIKQSIYRWRNGDWHIMAELGKTPETYSDRNNVDFQPLTRNYRSREQVVNFNLSLFRYIVTMYPYEEEKLLIETIYDEGFRGDNIEDFYQPEKKGGYVRFRAFPYRYPQTNCAEEQIMDMFDTMEDLLRRGAHPSDFMVLVRFNREAIRIVDTHAYLDPEQYPLLTQANFVSADSFLLENSQAVRLVIAALRVVHSGDEVAAKYIEVTTEKSGVIEQIRQKVNRKTPLYEAVSELVRVLCMDDEGCYHGTETAYINCLMDKTRQYVSSYGSNIEDFLVYWDDTLHKKSIPPSAGQAIRIMTVHSAKGLQAQTLFVPLCNWVQEGSSSALHRDTVWCQIQDAPDGGEDYIPVEDGKEMEQSLYRKDYEREHRNMRIDNLNMLYVALTRAEDNLYISSDFSVKSDGIGENKHVGKYLLSFTGLDITENEPFVEYEQGEVVCRKAKGEGRKGDVEWIASELWANSDQVQFVQSQEGALYTAYGDEAYRRVSRMDEGTLCHEIFAHLRKADELDQVLAEFESRGEIKDSAQKETIRQLIQAAWEGSAEMKDWFTAPWQLKLEEAIYLDNKEIRPDRVMINPETNEAIVLDYKFGTWKKEYITQVQTYKEALRRIGYSSVRGYLWFARENKLVEVRG